MEEPMSEVSDRIAAKHVLYRCTENGGTGVYGQPLEVYVGYECECGWTTKDSTATSKHIAEVTERAVRDEIVLALNDLEALDWRFSVAARIAKGD